MLKTFRLTALFAFVLTSATWAVGQDVVILNDTFDVGATPSIGNDVDDPLDASWASHGSTLSGLSRVDDSGGIGTGFALNVNTSGTFDAVEGVLPMAASLLIGESVTIQADTRFTQLPANNSAGFRVGLFEIPDTHVNSTVGYFGRIGTGGDDTLIASVDNGGDGAGGSGGDFAGLTGGATGAAFGSINDLLPHQLSMTITRTGATTATVDLNVDGVTRSGTHSGAIIERFDRAVFAEGGIDADFRVDNVNVIHHQHSRLTVAGNAADMEVQELVNGNTTQLVDTTNMFVGHGGPDGGWGREALFMFELPEPGTLANDFAANLEFNLVQKDNGSNSAIEFNADLYGLGFTTDETDLTAFDDFFHSGTAPGTATLLQTAILETNTTIGQVETTGAGDEALADFIASLYVDGAQAGDFAVLSLNPSQYPSAFNRYHIASGGTGTPPLLTLQAVVPEPSTIAIWALMGLSLAGFGYVRLRQQT